MLTASCINFLSTKELFSKTVSHVQIGPVSEIHDVNPPPNSPCIHRDTTVHSLIFGIMSNTVVTLQFPC